MTFHDSPFSDIVEIKQDRIVIKKPIKKEISVDEIALMEVKCSKNKTYNFGMILIGFFFIILHITVLKHIGYLFLGGLIIMIGIFLNIKSYYLQIIFRIPSRFIVPIDKSQINEAKQLVKRFHYKLNT